mgnify:CR=1 FL=1
MKYFIFTSSSLLLDPKNALIRDDTNVFASNGDTYIELSEMGDCGVDFKKNYKFILKNYILGKYCEEEAMFRMHWFSKEYRESIIRFYKIKEINIKRI